MTKKKPGAKRGAVPQNNEKALDAMALELLADQTVITEFDIDTKCGGKVEYEHNYSGAFVAMKKKEGDIHAHHGYSDRRKLYRKLKNEIDNPVIVKDDGESGEIVPRLEKAASQLYGVPLQTKKTPSSDS